ncbi:exo-alpha-sialidase [Dyadobacter frigoris]|uniref:Exo-alpha-sialidase n=1 Tax=Dyadobacter frigoris TaxID=2576211 RepID=A0A4U6CV48_9BACT|nr:exo-alpha-sialidase [Dyadobacter frigoris]TKT87615.1 hypothetical protein FDK13_28925 [Dyadobacter frigoris]GLU52675.1 hypothetical protein Dfri01_21360 [Dyadobacter frigoris]
MLLSKIGMIMVISIMLIFQKDLRPVDAIETEQNLGVGSQPEIVIDPQGIIRIVYGVKNGKERDLYYVSSSDGGKSYSKPFMLGNFAQMGLGMGRGPQIAGSKDYTVVTIGDHHGDLFAINLSNATNQWSAPIKVNDADTTAKEALSGLGAGKNHDVYTAWLDTRLGNNNLYGAFSADGGLTWGKNRLIYKGEQQGICDCCKPSVFFDQNGKINVMFRNKLNGARNMYLITSKDKGEHFGQAQKLGTGDYMINACPMDGGDLTVDAAGKVTTVWRRQMDVYVATPGSPELKLGAGRTPVTLQTSEGVAIAWEQDRTIQFRSADGAKLSSLGNGQYPKLALIKKEKRAVCVFEREGNIIVKSVAL